MKNRLSIAIDIGGTNTVYGFIGEDGTIYFKDEILTGNSSDPQVFVDAVVKELSHKQRKFEKDFTLSGIGIGAPNGNYFKGTVEYAPNLAWKGIIPVADMFASTMSLPVTLTNDANAAALGELFFGGAKGMKDFIFITLGTGLGSGLVINGKLVHGNNGFAGEIGHTIVIQHGRHCGCGRKGCLEQYCSATGLVKTYFEILKSEDRSLPDGKSLHEINGKYVYEKAMNGDEAAFYAFNYTGELLGFALANSAAYTDPEAIFLSGGLARAEEILFNPVTISFEKNLLRVYKNKIKILPSSLAANDAPLLGASSLVWSELEKVKYL